MKRALVIVGKAPRPGAAKTRLSPPLSPQEAARLYRAFLHDTATMALGLGWEQVTLIYPPEPGAERELLSILPDGLHLSPQPGSGLGVALATAFKEHLERAFELVILIGSDNPTLPPSLIESAAAGLNDNDVVIGPSVDGGYYLIGMREAHLGVFERISWSSDIVYGETLQRASELGLRMLPISEWYDVDTVGDLRRLRDELNSSSPELAPSTRAVLGSLIF